ncbi:T9SS type A sorting domain-containing protein [Flavivirga aquimarina]|uniref:T9SS type A sorting domain-containing protein n=1 Tax=Flavivirga aquimarina TaxID=2027862 RepID=A0ABT8W6A2_9FLAO|nr:M60 family peptidase N-terminal accessory domain-containing protein [Flavivirga aquimarina]MDO5968625.1 T9SS type A sorting domain-containing protein [Flavivirga aquimarina]
MKKNHLLGFLMLLCIIAYSANSNLDNNSDIDCTLEGLSIFNESDFINSLNRISDHILGNTMLSGTQITSEQGIIESNASLLSSNTTVMNAAFDLVELFETEIGPLFVTGPTSISRTSTGYELEIFMLYLQQHILDYCYTEANLLAYPSIFNDVKFETSSYFPGAVSPPSNNNISYTVKINGNHQAVAGSPYNYETEDARRPTGCYLAPGSVATVTVPSSLVGIGASILVGAHTWNNSIKPTIRRMDRVYKLYDINSTTVTIANPLGGGIYINIPYESSLGIVNVTIKNVVRSPYFANTVANQTSVSDWQNIERNHPAPWADFETDKVMHQVPTSWIYNVSDPSSAMDDWDKSMDAVSEMLGRPLLRSKTVAYQQVDLQFRGSAFFPGYPQCNITYNPNTSYNGNHDHFLVTGPSDRSHSDELDTFYHELGHAERIYKFNGEIEAFVNFLYVAVYNKKFGVSLNEAFEESSTTGYDHTLDEAAISWMIAENFRLGNPMSTTAGQYRQEFHYQPRGYAKYVDIVDLFGWEVLEEFYETLNEDYDAGTYESANINVNTVPTDTRTVRMSVAAGYDLRPLLHFWGKHPDFPGLIGASIEGSGAKKSAAIYDRLVHYKNLVPMTNEAFQTFGLQDFSQSAIDNANTTYTSNVDQSYNERFLNKFWNSYGATEGQAAKDEVQAIIDRYFPDGRPDEDDDDDCGNVTYFTPDPTKTYYIDSPVHNLRLAATGESEDAYTTSRSATGADVEWKFIQHNRGSWHIQRAAGGTTPRLRSDNSANPDMQETTSAGKWTYFDFPEGATAGTYYITLPFGPDGFERLQIDHAEGINMVSETLKGSWMSFEIIDVDDYVDPGEGNVTYFTPDPTKVYYIDYPASNLRLAATGEDEDAYFVPTTTTGADVEWQFVQNGDNWHIDRVAGGTKPRFRTDNSLVPDMNPTTSAGTWTQFNFPEGETTGTYYLNLPLGPESFQRVYVNSDDNLRMVPNTFTGGPLEFTMTEVGVASSNRIASKESITELTVEEMSKSVDDLLVYPNPMANRVIINGAKNSTIYLYDINGRTLLIKDISNEIETLDLSHLERGSYYVKIHFGTKIYTKKIIKK